MIKAGQIDNKDHAQLLSNYLYVSEIKNQIDCNQDGSWALWVLDSDQLEEGKSITAEFLKNPDDNKYKDASRLAETKKELKEKEDNAYRKNLHTRAELFSLSKFKLLSVTSFLIIISVLTAIITALGSNDSINAFLMITEFKQNPEGTHILYNQTLPEVQQGQIWRLLTPIFLHFSLLHIFFNMLWLKDLGHMIEKKSGPIFLVVMVMVFGISSNIGQFLMSGPSFGGMSGVVYGLLGYVWIRSKLDPHSGLFLHKQTIIMMIAWFFFCMTGLIGHIANTAHGVGLGCGVIWGFLAAKLHPTKIFCKD
jgi:GlpG protein